MKLDDVLQDHELSLDITPLIDIVFLLVLFFAVSTSFISGEDLTNLQREEAKLRWMVDVLENDKDTLKKSIATQKETNRSLRDQLEQAFRDFDALNVEVDALRSKSQQQAAAEQDLRSSLSEQTQRGAALNAEILRLRQELSKLQEVLALDRSQVERILQAQEQLREGLDDYLAANKVGLKREKQKLILQLSDKVLFASGSADLKKEGAEVLRRVGKIIKARMGKLEVQVAGHTDNVPVSSREGLLGDNWGLSAARAVNVVRFLEEDAGIDSTRLAALGYGEYRPIASNTTAQGRALNRRIELVLVPR